MKNYNDNHRKFVLSLYLGAYFCLVLPLTTYVLFQDGLYFKGIDLALYLAVAFVLVSGGFFAVLWSLPSRLFELASVLIVLIVFFSYYNFNFSDYEGKILGADNDALDRDYNLLEYLLFPLVVGCSIYFNRTVSKNILTIMFVVLMMSLSGLIASWAQSGQSSELVSENVNVDEGFYGLSENINVFHIILDGMQGSVFSKILQLQPGMARGFEGFTFFPDAMTPTNITYLAIPAILSGVAFDGQGSIKQYRRRAGMLKKGDKAEGLGRTLMTYLRDAGFDLEILSAPGSGMERLKFYSRYYMSDFGIERSRFTDLQRLLDLYLVRSLPWSGKRAVYQNGSWLFSREIKTKLPRANRAMRFISELGGKLKTGSRFATYKLIHLLAPHAPFTTDEDCGVKSAVRRKNAAFQQSSCVVRSIVTFIDQLKSIEAFDNSLIVINGDHGICAKFEISGMNARSGVFPRCLGGVNPLVLIKPPSGTGEMVTSHRQVELADLPATILEVLSIPHNLKGLSMLARNTEGERGRSFFDFKPNRVQASKLDRMDSVEVFEVNGSLFDARSWSRTSVDYSVDFDGLDSEAFIDIKNTGRQGSAAWVQWRGQEPEKHVYVQYDGERILIKIGEGFFSFRLPESYPDRELFLVDPVKGLKQEFTIE